jgi:hypothetical protein
MSNRRRPRADRRAERAQRKAWTYTHDEESPLPLGGIEPWIWAALDADEAERAGDASGALAAMRRRQVTGDGKSVWRPSRVRSLEQLELLGTDAPGWMVSRWVLAQALQHLDLDHERHEASRRRTRAATGAALELRGASGSAPDIDTAAAVSDTDWVYRQLYLWDLGGLDAFLEHRATPDLLAGSDRVAEWAAAPMGGYLYLGASERTLLWYDHRSSRTVTTTNIGSATRLLAGAHVIGRVVPAGDGAVFEGPPLEVPRAVARAVAAGPPAWLGVLREHAGLVQDGTIVTHHREWRSVASDVPIDVVTSLLLLRADLHRLTDDSALEAALATAALDLAAGELEREAREEERMWADESDGPHDDEWDGWAHVHAALTLPSVAAGLPAALASVTDTHLADEVLDRVAEPAATVLRHAVAAASSEAA